MANVVINKALKGRIATANSILRTSRDAAERTDAIAELEAVKSEIEALIASGNTPTNTSRRTIAGINATISRESGSAPSAERAVITQDFFTVTLTANRGDSIYALAEEIAERLESYILMEDVSAEYNIEIESGSPSFKRNGYTLQLGVDGSTTADQAFEKMANALVSIFDEMDSDYGGDVDEFLMEI